MYLKTKQDLFLQKIKVLMPNAKFDVRPYDGNEHLADYPIIRGNMLINWHPDNGECPSLEAIEAVRVEQVNTKEEADRKLARDDKYSKDLSMKAAYRLELKANPSLTFSDFLDSLEAEQV